MSARPRKPRGARRLACLLSLGAGLFASLTLVGWRYGFSRLPPPPAGVVFRPAVAPDWPDVGPTNCWYWPRELSRQLQLRESGPAFEDAYLSTVDAWARSGSQPSASQAELQQSLGGNPAIERAFRGFLAARANQPPAAFTASDVQATQLLAALPLLRAAEAEQQGRTIAAYDHLIDAWQFQARVPAATAAAARLIDERGVRQLDETLARPWRRLALHGPSLPAGDAARFLAALTVVTNALPPLPEIYAGLAGEALAGAGSNWPPPLDWRRVRFASRQALSLMAQDAFATIGVVFAALAHHPQPLAQTWGLSHLGRPARMILRGGQDRIARGSDVRGATEGALGQARTGLAGAGSGTGLAGVAAGREPTWFQSAFDRPAVWRALAALPDPRRLIATRRHWLACLESCRLTLALRLYHDRHGRWPETLAALVPGILPALPPDPSPHTPWQYERTAAGWEIRWPTGSDPSGEASAPAGAESFAFGSGEY